MKKFVLAVTACALIGSASVAGAAPAVKTVKATIKYFNYVVNGQTKLTADALVFNGTTYVPIREAASLFNYSTTYDGAEDTANVYVVRAGGETAFSLNAANLKDGETTSVVTNKSHLITVKKELGSIVLSKKDVIAAGYIVESFE
ncbi:copper amine oxidase N-terminal domain-containing protein [Paenibacillus sp. p3-SID1389]|uniref:copper amine oxidase N-terminal domain-containing protein n=1 Tax=Paenibacillus sp. p3-SID1389 TaxID=2916364 RepID=UPI0021A3CDFA|nr:copper amine oxidase N-terminal domain-containing protein [Paenibacillus sp. p3-SID1389]MCT2196178.1 copper amine oxidase N-terminal domain-containing protein [Paenibacillus sp. p3-SID1389]